jgi:hypothetical protein
MLGARVGQRAEVSTAAHLDPDLLAVAQESFVADMASVGAATFANGRMALPGRSSGSPRPPRRGAELRWAFALEIDRPRNLRERLPVAGRHVCAAIQHNLEQHRLAPGLQHRLGLLGVEIGEQRSDRLGGRVQKRQ